LRLSNKIIFAEAVPEEKKLSSIWGGVFFHPVFVESGSDILGMKGKVRTIEYQSREIGVSNLLFQEKPGLNAATIPLLFQYFGPVFYDSEMEGEFIDEVIAYYRETSDYIYLSFPPEFNSIAKFAGNWKINKAVTLAVDASQLDRWGNDFRDDVKNKINKARRSGVKIELSDSFNEKLWEVTFSRKGLRPPIKPSDLKRWCSVLMEGSLLRIYTAVIDGREVAFRGQLIYGGFAYDWIAGSDPDYHHLGTNQLLMTEIGSDLRKAGISIWDLVDARVSSIAEFKKSFGALEYYHWQVSGAFNIKGKLFGALRRLKNA